MLDRGFIEYKKLKKHLKPIGTIVPTYIKIDNDINISKIEFYLHST